MRGWTGSAVLVAIVGWSAAARGDGALDKPAFTASPDELLAVAKAAPRTGDPPVIVLRDQRDTSFDARGRATVHLRRIYAIRAAIESVDEAWADVTAPWVPYYQDRPVLRARVIGPTGEVTELEPGQIRDAAMTELGGRELSDRRRLSLALPLPTLVVGAVVEYEIASVDRDPPPVAADLAIHRLDQRVPVMSTVISVAAPVGSELRRVERGLPAGVHPRRELSAGRERWTYELPARQPLRWREPSAPDAARAAPYVAAAPATSWAAVARGYGALIDRRIAEGRFALPAELPRAATPETIVAIVAWLHHQIRDTGMPLDDTTRIPRTPAETVKRGTGDGKDRATLLIALLRQAGIRAELALIATASGHDADPDLPGITGFDHPLVRARLGGRDVWIDPEHALLRPGQLPHAAQGRRALVIADGTTALATTPRAASGDNVVREVRSFTAAEWGPARLAVTTREIGEFELGQRARFRDAPAGTLDKLFGPLVEIRYGGTLVKSGSTPPDDLTAPFEHTLAVDAARAVHAGHPQIDVTLHPRDALARLPRVVTHEPPVPRVDDFEWPVPHVYEIENRIAVPDGFTVPALQPERVVRLASATFTEQRRSEGQTLIVTFRFDTGKPRLSPAELAAVRAATAAVDDEIHIAIDRTASALGRAGKYREAVAEAERMIALHPREALHQSELGMLYTLAGAGDAARRAARQAVALDPRDPDALVSLAWVLIHDRLGRGYTHDWDRAGAIAALRKALALDPRHAGAAVELARALARGASGAMFARDADLLGAAEAWHIALARPHRDEETIELAQVLIWSGNPTGAELVARSAAVSEDRDRWIVAAIAEARGAREAIRVAGELRSADQRGVLITWAAGIAALRRHYDTARGLIAELAGSPQLPAGWDKLFARARPHPAAPPPAQLGDPRAALTDLLLALAEPHGVSPVFWDAALEDALRRTRWVATQLPGWIDRSDALADLFTSGEVRIEGGAGLWRATVDAGNGPRQFYLALDRGVAKVVGTSDLFAYTGRHVLTAALGDPRAIDQAHQLLAWVRGDVDRAKASNAVLFRRLWDAGEPRTAEALRLAAAVLSGFLEPDRVLAIGAHCSSPLPVGGLACHAILGEAYYRRQRWEAAAAEYTAIRTLGDKEFAPWAATLGAALARAGRLDDADRVIDAALAADPDDTGALQARFRVAVERGDPAEVARRADAIAQRAKVTASELNQIAWSRLADGGDLQSARELARRGVEADKNSSAVRNTLAAIEAELGDLGPAEADQRGALGLHGGPPDDSDWYVAARIDEQLGLVDDAVAIYKKIATAPNTERLSASAFAGRRLAALGRAP